MESKTEDDLQPEKTDGFKVGEKKTVEEYAKLGKGTVRSNPLRSTCSPISFIAKV